MDIKVICADCGRHIGTFVRLGKRQDVEIEIHGCYHKDTYDHIKEQAERIEGFEKDIENRRNYETYLQSSDSPVYSYNIWLRQQALKEDK